MFCTRSTAALEVVADNSLVYLQLEEDKTIADAQDALDAQQEAIEAGMDDVAQNDAEMADM